MLDADTWGVLNDLRKEGEKKNPKAMNNFERDIGTKYQQDKREQSTDNLAAIMALIRSALDAYLAKGTKKHKSSLLRYWGMYCAAFDIDIKNFGANPTGSDDAKLEFIRLECIVLAGFSSFVVTVPRRKNKSIRA